MEFLRKVVAFTLCASLVALADGGNSFSRVRYNGGTVATQVDPKDWDNKLVVTSDLINLTLKDGQKIDILPGTVTALSYGQEAHRRVGTFIALAFISPVALFGLFHKTRLHFISVEYVGTDSKPAALLLQGDKDNYRAILVALQGVTQQPVSASEEDRRFIPVGVKTMTAKAEPSQAQAAPGATAEPTDTSQKGAVTVTSAPDGAEIYADGAFVGNAPATLKLMEGKHTIKVLSTGYKDWSRDISVSSGSELKLNAALEKLP
jgi:hypothetical protein